MKRVLITGLIGGFLVGVVNTIFSISGVYELFSITPFYIPVTVETITVFEMTIGIVWGILFCSFYAFFYDCIPGEGVKKGLVYSLIIWIIAPGNYWVTSAAYGFYLWAIPYALTTFFSFGIVYGLVLGYLYRKPGD